MLFSHEKAVPLECVQAGEWEALKARLLFYSQI